MVAVELVGGKQDTCRGGDGQTRMFVITIQTSTGIRTARPIFRTESSLIPRGSLRPQTGQVRSLESVVKPHPEHCLISTFLTTNAFKRSGGGECLRGGAQKEEGQR
jgi:hypothetical protein